MSIKDIMSAIKNETIYSVDLRFTDTYGKEQHVTISADSVTEDFFKEGKMFDGSSIAGWRSIDKSDMVLMPDPETAIIDPFYEQKTLTLRCDVLEPATMTGYDRCPRTIAKRVEDYLQSTGIADSAFFGPEPEFFIFDDVRWEVAMQGSFYKIDSEEAAWNSRKSYDGGNPGHRPRVKGGYFPVPPVDSSQDIREAMCLILGQMGVKFEAHHHEVATGNQNEISTPFNTLLRKADEMQIYKYVVHNISHIHGKTATFMPKPIVGDNGNGMHCHQSLAKNGKNLFTGDNYAGLSDLALYYIGGIIKHAPAINAFTNSTTNSYKRLVPGFEAPVMLAYSSCNRSASIRVPFSSPKGRRIEVRFPDPASNPYFAFSAMVMAGLDGIKNKIHPGEARDMDLYELSAAESAKIPTVCSSLEQALDCLDRGRAFLTIEGVFSDAMLDAYIALKRKEVQRLQMTTHPVEFDMYYSC